MYDYFIVICDKRIRSLCNIHHEFDHTTVHLGVSQCWADAVHTIVSMLLGVQRVISYCCSGLKLLNHIHWTASTQTMQQVQWCGTPTQCHGLSCFSMLLLLSDW